MSRRSLVPVLITTALLGVSACGSSGGSAASGSGQEGGTQQQGAQQNAQGRSPGANGEIVDVSGTTLQVQGQSGQTAVTYTDATTLTQQVAGTAKDVTVGSCVMVTDASAASSGATSAPTAQPTTIAASTVRITPAGTDGTCQMGGAGGPGGGARPSGAPTDMPSGGLGGAGFRGGFGTFGTVASVSGTGFTVTSTGFGQSKESTTVTVTTSGTTTYTTQQAATAAAIKVGVCASARGDADDTGAVAATAISLSDKVDGACTGGFGGGRPGQAAPSGNAA